MRRSNMQAIASVGAMTRPQFRQMPTLDLAGAFDNFYAARDAADKRTKNRAYVEALQGGDQDQINSAWAAYDPQSYANFMLNQEKRAEDRQWALDDLAAQQAFQRELADINFKRQMELENVKNQNAWGLKRWDLENTLAQKEMERQQALEDAATQREFQKELETLKNQNARSLKEFELTGGLGTTAQQNVKAMIDAGYTPEEAWAMYYGGNNPTLDMANLGKKGMEAYDKQVGKDLAEREKQRQEAQDEYNGLIGVLDRAEELLPMSGTDTFIDRKTPTMFFDEKTQMARGELRNILGGLRLDQMKYMKGAISDKEQEFLSDVVSGDLTKYTPPEIKGTFKSIRRKAEQAVKKYENKPSLKDFVVSVDVNDPRVQEALQNGYSMEEIQAYLGK